MASASTSRVRAPADRSPMTRPVTLGVIVGNRGFFPHHLATEGRETILRTLDEASIQAIVSDVGATRYGAIESLEEARQCAEVFRQHRDQIDGIIVTLPKFWRRARHCQCNKICRPRCAGTRACLS